MQCQAVARRSHTDSEGNGDVWVAVGQVTAHQLQIGGCPWGTALGAIQRVHAADLGLDERCEAAEQHACI